MQGLRSAKLNIKTLGRKQGRAVAAADGEAAFFTFRSPGTFDFNQEKAFKGLRDAAIARYSPIYVYLPKQVAATKTIMEGFITEVLKFRSQGKAGRIAFTGYLKKKFGVEISSEVAIRLLRYPGLKNLLAGVLTIQDSISQSKIVENPESLQGKMTVRILYPDSIGISAFPPAEITTLEKARLELQKKARQLFWQVDSRILNPVIQVALATLQPNLSYDQQKNERGLEEIISEYPASVITYKPVEVLVPFRKVLNENEVLLLRARQEAAKKELYGLAPWVLFIICFAVLLYNLLLLRVFSPCWRMEPPYQLFLVGLTLTILLCKACLLFTPWPVYVLPFAVLPLLLVLLHQERISVTFTTVLGAILISLFSGRNLAIFLFFTFGGLVAVLTSFRLRKRSHIFLLRW